VRRLTHRAASLGFAILDTDTGEVIQPVVS
jgi:hypothetical protein